MNQSIGFAPSQSQAPKGFGAGDYVSQAPVGKELRGGLGVGDLEACQRQSQVVRQLSLEVRHQWGEGVERLVRVREVLPLQLGVGEARDRRRGGDEELLDG